MPDRDDRQVPPIEIKNWLGMYTNVSPHDIPPGGAQDQVNVTSIRRGVLETRKGVKTVSFEN